MSKTKLKEYVLGNRDDIEAIHYLFSRRIKDKKSFSPLCKNGTPIEENINILKQELAKHLKNATNLEEEN